VLQGPVPIINPFIFNIALIPALPVVHFHAATIILTDSAFAPAFPVINPPAFLGTCFGGGGEGDSLGCSNMSGKTSQLGNAPRGLNPYVEGFLTIYSQSEWSTGGTRGYDLETYVEARLDRNLIPSFHNQSTRPSAPPFLAVRSPGRRTPAFLACGLG